mgnify:CR=1 FL=1
MRRRILIPLGDEPENYQTCAECDFLFRDPTTIKFQTKDGEPLCLPCALSCAWCDQRLTSGTCIVVDDGLRQFVCKACADLQEEVKQ